MIIYGTAILAICHLLGDYLGNTLGMLIGVKANVGGVAISMILLILSKELLAKKRLFTPSDTVRDLVLVRYVHPHCSGNVSWAKRRGCTFRRDAGIDCLGRITDRHSAGNPLSE